MVDLRDKFRGALIGTAIGDAFGGPLEGVSSSDAPRLVARRLELQQPWSYTDDAQTMIALARSLVHLGDVDSVDILDNLARDFDPARGYGRGTRLALQAYLSGTPWHQCAFACWSEGSRGNGAAARTAPVSCLFAHHPSLSQLTRRAAEVTHAHPDGIAGATLQAHALRALLLTRPDSFDSGQFLNALLLNHDFPRWVTDRLALVRSLLNSEPMTVAQKLGSGVLAVDSVPCAIWAFASHHTRFEDVVTSACSLGGDTDTICAMAGALAGALLGYQAIPEWWRLRLQHERPGLPEITELADNLHFLSERERSPTTRC